MIAEFVEFASVGIFALITVLLLLLPSFDVVQYIHLESDIFSDSIGWLNWFVPVDELFIIAGAWLVCLALYQGYLIFGGFLFKFTK